ncbi:hypothetical protein PM082_001507 [Marasmius tenuissimus]|nr:hypothetical protein PM082_001507 [Marasmius tenuissimus]
MEIEQAVGPGPSQLFAIPVEKPASPSLRAGKLSDGRMKGRPSWYEPEPAYLASQTTIIMDLTPPRRPSGIIIIDLDDSEGEFFEDWGKTQGDIEISPALLQSIRQDDILRSTLPSSTGACGQALVLYRPLTIWDGKDEERIPTPIQISTSVDVETTATDVDVEPWTGNPTKALVLYFHLS